MWSGASAPPSGVPGLPGLRERRRARGSAAGASERSSPWRGGWPMRSAASECWWMPRRELLRPPWLPRGGRSRTPSQAHADVPGADTDGPWPGSASADVGRVGPRWGLVGGSNLPPRPRLGRRARVAVAVVTTRAGTADCATRVANRVRVSGRAHNPDAAPESAMARPEGPNSGCEPPFTGHPTVCPGSSDATPVRSDLTTGVAKPGFGSSSVAELGTDLGCSVPRGRNPSRTHTAETRFAPTFGSE